MPKDLNVILISLDCVRADHLGCYGYQRKTSPNIDALAEKGVLFEQAIAASFWTLPSHASMLTGLYPVNHGARAKHKINESAAMLPQLLQAQGFNLSAEFIGTEQRFQPEVEVTLFRIAQGAIGNILEHSEAKNVSIKLECTDTECVLNIADDGKGFDVNKLTRVEHGGRGAGLFTMRERTSLLGGTGYVKSKPGQGTKIIVKVPLERSLEDLVEDTVDE